MIHKPVLVGEVLKYLDPKPNENFIDCTAGEGGHAAAILEKTACLPAGRAQGGKLLGIDVDPHQIENCKLNLARFGERAILLNDSYANLKEIVERKNFLPVNGILLDLGMSSAQLEASHKGFSFKADQGLDMRYNDASGYFTAEKIVNEWPEQDLEKIFREFGEEKFSKKIAKNIVEQRKRGRIKTTFQLIEVIKKSAWDATRTFQALRIAVNRELENLETVLPRAVSVLAPGGRLAIISFHSLEDRIVKNFLKNNKSIKILNKKPITASKSEIGLNTRSRSAKLRAAQKL